jgi:hypothetical protein
MVQLGVCKIPEQACETNPENDYGKSGVSENNCKG